MLAKRFLENGLKQIDMWWTSLSQKKKDSLKEKLQGEANLYSHFPVAIPDRTSIFVISCLIFAEDLLKKRERRLY